jgi:tetratricopeptide (TPR) repeat protein
MGFIYKEMPYDNDKAIVAFQEALQRNLSSRVAEEVREELAECLLKQSDYEQALQTLEGCNAPVGDTPKVAALRAECLWALGRVPEARDLLDGALKEKPRSAELLRVRAKLHLEAQEHQAAAALLERFVEADPHDFAGHFQLAQAYESLGRSAEAAAQRRLGQQTQNDWSEITKLHKVAMDHPWDAAVRQRLATLYQKLDKHDLAAIWLKAAAACPPEKEVREKP